MDKEEEEYKLEEEQVDVGLDLDDEDQDIMDLMFQFWKQDDDYKQDQDDDEEDEDDDDEIHKSTRWYDPDTCKTVRGVEVLSNKRKGGERDDLDLCSICLKPWTMDKVHQMSSLPCGHIYGMSCIKEWMQGRFSHQCPQCLAYFSFENVRLLYATRLCIPADQKESITRFPYNKEGFTAFKQYQRELLTNAFNNRSHALKQRADVLVRQKDAMKQRTELLNRMANTQKKAEALACPAGVEKLACVEKRAEVLRCRAIALGLRGDEYLRKADAFGQQAKALRQRAKASRQQVGAYMASMKFFKQRYKELLGLHDIRSQMDTEEDHKPMEANKEYNQEEEEQQVELELDLDDEDQDIMDLMFQFEKQDDDYKQDHDEIHKSTRWYDPDTCKTVRGVEVLSNKRKRGERGDLDLCSICLKPWTMDKVHQMSSLPCGHIYGMSCIKEWMQGRFSHQCPQCLAYFSFENVRHLYATRLCIPADQKESITRFPYNKEGFTAFKQYQRELLTNAFNNRSHALKQRADVLVRQKDAMKQRTELLNRMANTQKKAEALACPAGVEKLACVEKRAEVLRCRAIALGLRGDEYLRKADAFGQQAKALRQRAKASRQQVGAYVASMQFFKQRYKELLGLHDIRSQMDTEEDHKPMEANKEYNQEEEEQVELELDLDDNNDDFEQVEEMTFPLVISKKENGKTVHEIEVPVMKDDDFIDDSMYRDDHELTDSQNDFAEALDSRPPRIQAKDPDVCTLCYKHWTGDQIHQVCCLPCGHIFGASCIKTWLQTDASSKKCPQCNIYCTLEDVRPLNATSIRIPAAIKGADDQKTSTRRFPLCNRGIIAFHHFETARRNFALKKWLDAMKRLDGVLGRKYEAMKRRTDLLDRMKALEQQGGSLCQADASLADEYMRRATACEGRAEALRLRVKAYNQRVNALQPRLSYFVKCVEDNFKLG